MEVRTGGCRLVADAVLQVQAGPLSVSRTFHKLLALSEPCSFEYEDAVWGVRGWFQGLGRKRCVGHGRPGVCSFGASLESCSLFSGSGVDKEDRFDRLTRRLPPSTLARGRVLFCWLRAGQKDLILGLWARGRTVARAGLGFAVGRQAAPVAHTCGVMRSTISLLAA